MMGTVYLIHFDEPIGNPGNPRGLAQHYLGWSSLPVIQRLKRHENARGARIMSVCREKGVAWKLVRTWDGPRALERKLKNLHNSPKLCPICRAQAREKEMHE
jgi:putative endonuclease